MARPDGRIRLKLTVFDRQLDAPDRFAVQCPGLISPPVGRPKAPGHASPLPRFSPFVHPDFSVFPSGAVPGNNEKKGSKEGNAEQGGGRGRVTPAKDGNAAMRFLDAELFSAFWGIALDCPHFRNPFSDWCCQKPLRQTARQNIQREQSPVDG